MASIVPTVYTQVLRDIANEKLTDARNAGILDPGRTTLNVQTAFTAKYDKEDTYRFRLAKNGKVGVSVLPKKPEDQEAGKKVNIQLLNKAGQVIADSTAKSGKLKENYDKLALSNFDGKTGDYYVRFTRGAGIKPNEAIAYNAQITSGYGTTRDDYTSVEKPPAAPTIYASARTYSSSLTATTVSATVGTLLDSSNFFSQIQNFSYVDVST